MRTLALVAAMSFPASAVAADLSVRVEPGVAIPLGAPQSRFLAPGGGAAVSLA